jgi:hypothetical protein
MIMFLGEILGARALVAERLPSRPNKRAALLDLGVDIIKPPADETPVRYPKAPTENRAQIQNTYTTLN